MKKTAILIIVITLITFSCKFDKDKKEIQETTTQDSTIVKSKQIKTDSSTVDIHVIPISHATFILEADSTVIYVDPVGGSKAFEGQPKPNIILITDIHGDHLNTETLTAVSGNAQILAPHAVADKLPDSLKNNLDIINNGQSISLKTSKMDVTIDAIPMYNLRQEALQYHEKGRGNGYIVTLAGKRIYISGDTEDIPEMRNLKDIDMAFVCMNLPYTMTVESAAEAVLDFKPKVVYPYHYRGTNGLSDVSKFKDLVYHGDSNVVVKLLNWYPE